MISALFRFKSDGRPFTVSSATNLEDLRVGASCALLYCNRRYNSALEYLVLPADPRRDTESKGWLKRLFADYADARWLPLRRVPLKTLLAM